MMAVFSIGIGASAILSGLAETPLLIALTSTAVGVFAAIYYPLGSSKAGMVFSAKEVFGNQGVAVAALLTNYLIDTVGWRSSYFVPGAFSVLIGVFAFLVFCVAAFVIFVAVFFLPKTRKI